MCRLMKGNRGVGALGYLILAAVILVILVVLFLVVGIVFVILAGGVVGGLALAVFGPKPYALWVGGGITVISIIAAVILVGATGLGF